MLLLDSHSAIARAQQMPAQWGPEWAVESSVRYWAERIGIDPASLSACWPMWGAGSARPVIDRVGWGAITPVSGRSALDERGLWVANAQGQSTPATGLVSPNPGVWHDEITSLSVRLRVRLDADDGGPLVLLDIGGSTNGLLIGYRTSPDTIIFATAVDTALIEIASTSTYVVGDEVDLVAVYDAGAMRLYLDGQLEASGSNGSSIPSHSGDPCVGGSSIPTTAGQTALDNDTVDDWGGNISDLTMLSAAPSADAVAALAEQPYLLLQPRPAPPVYLFGATSSTVALSGSATATSAGSGALSVAQSLAGAAAAVADAAGVLSRALSLAGSAEATAAGSGSLGATVGLAGQADALASGEGALAVARALAGEASAQAAGSGALTIQGQVSLAGSATATSQGQAALSVARALAGVAVAVADGSGTLTVGQTVALEGVVAAAQSVASGALGVTRGLTGAAAAQAAGEGALALQTSLAGAAEALAAGSGDLGVLRSLEGAAAAVAAASGVLTTDIVDVAEISITFAAGRSPAVTFAGRSPALTFAGRSPTITFH